MKSRNPTFQRYGRVSPLQEKIIGLPCYACGTALDVSSVHGAVHTVKDGGLRLFCPVCAENSLWIGEIPKKEKE